MPQLFLFNFCTQAAQVIRQGFGIAHNMLLYLLTFAGVIIVLLTILDILWTTLWIDGADGPITKVVTVSVWWFHRNTLGKINNKLLSLSGVWILFLIFIFWIILFSLGWYFIFLAKADSVIDSRTDVASNWLEKIYFVGYCLTTLGNGDFKPSKGIYQLLTPAITASGFSVFSLGITYFISVISAAIERFQFAFKITSIGETAEDFVINVWMGKHFNSIDMILSSFALDLNMLNDHNKTYPVLHYFHTSERKKSVHYALAVFEDALNIMEFGLDEKEKPAQYFINSARNALNNYLLTISSMNLAKIEKVAPAISIQKLAGAGIKTIDSDKFQSIIETQNERRKLLYGMVKIDGWEWYC